jgi:hypothetical protein
MDDLTLQDKIEILLAVLKTIEDAVEEANLQPHEPISIDFSVYPNYECVTTMSVSQWMLRIHALRVMIVQHIHNGN